MEIHTSTTTSTTTSATAATPTPTAQRPALGQEISQEYGRIVTIGDSMFSSVRDSYIRELGELLGTIVVCNARSGARPRSIAEQGACSMDSECKWSVMNDA